jgi:hypothetical protein
MTRILIIALSFLSLPVQAETTECQPRPLSAETLALVKPLMQLRIQQVKDSFTADGHWIAESPVAPEVGKRFEALLSNRTSTGDEALAYLLTVYMGEGPGEALVCEVTNRGTRMVPLIREFQACAPLIGLEPLHKFVRGSGTLSGMALKGISSGKRCHYD